MASVWTIAGKNSFLRELARSGSVARAATAIGGDEEGARGLRERNRVFAGRWDAAIAAACQRLEEQLLAHALGEDPSAGRATPFDPALAIKVLAMLRGSAGPGGRAARPAAGVDGPDDAAVTQALRRQLGALARGQGGK